MPPAPPSWCSDRRALGVRLRVTHGETRSATASAGPGWIGVRFDASAVSAEIAVEDLEVVVWRRKGPRRVRVSLFALTCGEQEVRDFAACQASRCASRRPSVLVRYGDTIQLIAHTEKLRGFRPELSLRVAFDARFPHAAAEFDCRAFAPSALNLLSEGPR